MSRRVSALARIYARAFFDVSGKEFKSAGDWEALKQAIVSLRTLLVENKNLRIALLSPITSAKEKTTIIEKIAGKVTIPSVLVKFLYLMAKKGRTALLDQILEALEEVQVEKAGGLYGEVVSAEPVQKSELDSLAAAFTKKLGKKVELRVKTDPNLLSGLKVTVSGVTYDGTLRSQLDQLKEIFVHGSAGHA